MEVLSGKQPTTFLSLPAELRNYIYTLSRCLIVHQCGHCTRIATDSLLTYELVHQSRPFCSGCLICCTQCVSRAAQLHSTEITAQSLWVNRSSLIALQGHGNSASAGRMKGLREAGMYHGQHRSDCKQWDHGALHISRVAQPEITKVSKQVRNQTLPIFYGSHSFLFTIMDTEIDGATVLKWLGTIGKDSAALLRNVNIVCRSKDHAKYIDNQLKPAMRKLGVEIDEDVVTVKRVPYPYCYCERCIRKLLGET